MAMIVESCQLLFAGVNYVFVPAPAVDTRTSLSFQAKLAENKLEFDRVENKSGQLMLFREKGSQLRVQLSRPNPAMAQLLILAENPQYTLGLIDKEMEAACDAFEANWSVPQQIIARDATLRHLYSVEEEHAFQYLWEQRLRQPPEDLEQLGGGVLGGGLRLVLPPHGERTAQVEIKIESFLKETGKVFLETQMLWQQPMNPGERLNPSALLNEVKEYAEGAALSFASGKEGSPQ